MRLITGFVAGAMLCAGGAAAQEESRTGLELYRAQLEWDTRDGSWWYTSNAEYQADNEEEPDAFAVRQWAAPGGLSSNGCLWSIDDGEVAAVHWHFYSGWDMTSSLPFFYQVHTSGQGTGMGWQTYASESLLVIEQTFEWTDGSGERVLHRTERTGEDTRVTRSFGWHDGEWQPRRVYTWHRRTSGDTPCGPDR